ncbi:MAG: HNH endonuclease [Candidatus Aminicenantes bacterium]|nr:HNH endonuclease [Candidatus Aminicenantes bacterium]
MKTDELIFLETDDACAYCGIKQRDNLSIHHIEGNTRKNDYENMIALCHNCHHRLTNNKGISREDIKNRKKDLIFKTLTQVGVNALKMAYRKKAEIGAIPFMVFHLVEMGYLKKTGSLYWSGDVDYLAKYELTEKGQDLYEKWLK